MNEVNIIIFKSDLNGTITPGNRNTWQIENTWTPWWTQNNSNSTAYIRALRDSNIGLINKNDVWNYNWSEPHCFLPVIEYRE